MLEGSLPLGTFHVFNIPFPCSILCIVVVLLWGSSGTMLSLIPACLLGIQQRVSHRVPLHKRVLDHASCPRFLISEWALSTESQSFDSKTSIFPRQHNHPASWEASVDICWLRPAHLLAPQPFLFNFGRIASSVLPVGSAWPQLWTLSWLEANRSTDLDISVCQHGDSANSDLLSRRQDL